MYDYVNAAPRWTETPARSARPPPPTGGTLGMWASIAFGIPLVVLVLGASLVWAFSGFAAKRPLVGPGQREIG